MSGDRKYFLHEHALCESESVGDGTRIWAFAHVLSGARIGNDCNVCDHVFIEGGVVVGDRVTIKSGVQLWSGATVEDDVFIGPNATFINDPFPRSRHPPETFTPILVQHGASIGANATILCGVTIGANAMVGAGAVVTSDVPANAIVYGNPAHIRGYVSMDGRRDERSESRPAPAAERREIGRAALHRLPQFVDLRGALVPLELEALLPFEVRRVFLVHDVPSRHVRGEHAHRELHQFVVCVAGECSLLVDDGAIRREVRLDSPTLGIHLPPMVWSTQFRFSPDAVLLVLASAPYDPDDYIRNYDDFLREYRVARGPGSERNGEGS